MMSAAHWAAAWWICCILCYETSVSGVLICINVCILYTCMSLPSMFSVIVKASPIHVWMRIMRTASLCRTASTCSFNALACCILASHWMRNTIFAVPLTLSYCCWSSHTFVSRHWMLGSSCGFVRTSSAYSNKVVQSCTAPPISSNPIAIALTCYSQTSGGVECCAFNCILVI